MRYMSFLKKDDTLLEKFNEIWKKVKNNIKKEFDSESVCNEKEFDSESVCNENQLEAKKNPLMEKSTQIFTIIKYQKTVLNLFVYQ